MDMQIAKKEKTMPKSDPSQSGRSMVEMLIVLVIMGVLSVGGIVGFNWGMNRYRANRVVSEMQQDSAILKQRLTRQSGAANASYASQINAEIDDMTVRYTTTPDEADAFADCGAGRFARVAKISGDICNHLIKMDSLSPVARYTGCPVVLNGVVLVQADGEIAEDIECLEQDNALIIGVRPETQGGAHGAAVVSERSCRVKGDVIAHGTERDCGKCVDGVMQRQPTGLGECETCGPATGYMIQDDPTCGGCTPSDVCHECVDGSEVLIDAGKSKVKTGSPDTCVECLANTDCTDPAKPVCNGDNACEGCSSGFVWNGSACSCPEHSSTTVTEERIGETNCYCEEGYVVNSTSDGCIAIEGKSCMDNGGCGGNGSGYFCAHILGGTKYGEVNYLTGPTTPGRCLKVSDYISGRSDNYIWSLTSMNWYTAQYFCAANVDSSGEPMSMPSIQDIQCYANGGASMMTSGDGNGNVYCCKQNTTCAGYWNSERNRFSDQIASIGDDLNTAEWFWTSSRAANTAFAKTICLVQGWVGNSDIRVVGHTALNQGFVVCGTPPPSCPEHSSRTVTAQRIGETACYCEAGYVVNGTSDECVECNTDADCSGRTDGKTVCDTGTGSCICPEHASTTVTDQRIGETACYCEAGYVVNGTGDGCVECNTDNDCAGRVDGMTSCDTVNRRCLPTVRHWDFCGYPGYGLWTIASGGPYDEDYILKGYIYYADDAITIYANGETVLSWASYNYGCSSEDCAQHWQAYLPQGSTWYVNLYNGGKNLACAPGQTWIERP